MSERASPSESEPDSANTQAKNALAAGDLEALRRAAVGMEPGEEPYADALMWRAVSQGRLDAAIVLVEGVTRAPVCPDVRAALTAAAAHAGTAAEGLSSDPDLACACTAILAACRRGDTDAIYNMSATFKLVNTFGDFSGEFCHRMAQHAAEQPDARLFRALLDAGFIEGTAIREVAAGSSRRLLEDCAQVVLSADTDHHRCIPDDFDEPDTYSGCLVAAYAGAARAESAANIIWLARAYPPTAALIRAAAAQLCSAAAPPEWLRERLGWLAATAEDIPAPPAGADVAALLAGMRSPSPQSS